MSGALAGMVSSSPGVINPALPSGTGTGTAAWTLTNDGSYSISGQSAGNWLEPASAAIAAMWEVFVTVTGGDPFDVGTVDTWLNLGTSRSWSHTSAKTTSFVVLFRDASQTVQSTQAVTLTTS